MILVIMMLMLGACNTIEELPKTPNFSIAPDDYKIKTYKPALIDGLQPRLLSVTTIDRVWYECGLFDDSTLLRLKVNIQNTLYPGGEIPDNISYYVDIIVDGKTLYRLDYPCKLEQNYKHEASFFDVREISLPITQDQFPVTEIVIGLVEG